MEMEKRMSTSQQDEQAERRRVFAQDQFVQRQATTMHAHAIADAAMPRGRFSAVEAVTVVGSKADAASAYPPAAAHQCDPVGPEPSLGYRIDEMPTEAALLSSPPPTDDDPVNAVPSTPLDVEQRGAGSPSLSPELVAQRKSSQMFVVIRQG